MGSPSVSGMWFRTILVGWFVSCSHVMELLADTGVEMPRILRNTRALEGRQHTFRRENNPFQQHDPMGRYSFKDESKHEFARERYSNDHLDEPIEVRHSIEKKVADDVLETFYSEQDMLDFDKTFHLDESDEHQEYTQHDFHRFQKAPVKQSKKRAYRKRKKSTHGRDKHAIDHAWRRNSQRYENDEDTVHHFDDDVVDNTSQNDFADSKTQNRLDNIGRKIPKSIKNMIKKSGRKVLDSVLRQQSPFHTKQGNDPSSNDQGMLRTIMSSMSKAFSPDHVSLHIIANWVNVLAISVIWVGLASMFSSSTIATGREYNPPFWDEFLPDKDEVALAFREIAQVAETWGHDEL